VPGWPDPARGAPETDRTASGPGAIAAATGLIAALAPLTEWYSIRIEVPSLTTSLSTTGWGSTGISSSSEVPLFRPLDSGWLDWTLAGIPDGAVASLLAAVIAVAGVRMVLSGGRSAKAASAVVAVAGAVGVVWTYLAWRTAEGATRSYEDALVASGFLRSRVEEAVSGNVGFGPIICAVAFLLAAMAGFAALWAATPATPPPTDHEGPDTSWSPS
jgi:hypothetical protein